VTRGAPPPLLVYFVCAPIETYLGGAAVFFSFGFWLLVFFFLIVFFSFPIVFLIHGSNKSENQKEINFL
jgi:hypothetical protein